MAACFPDASVWLRLYRDGPLKSTPRAAGAGVADRRKPVRSLNYFAALRVFQ